MDEIRNEEAPTDMPGRKDVGLERRHTSPSCVVNYLDLLARRRVAASCCRLKEAGIFTSQLLCARLAFEENPLVALAVRARDTTFSIGCLCPLPKRTAVVYRVGNNGLSSCNIIVLDSNMVKRPRSIY